MNFGSDGILIFRSNISKYIRGGRGGKKKGKNIDRSIRLLYRTPLFLVQRITQKMGDGLFGDYYRRGQKGGEKRKMEGKL